MNQQYPQQPPPQPQHQPHYYQQQPVQQQPVQQQPIQQQPMTQQSPGVETDKLPRQGDPRVWVAMLLTIIGFIHFETFAVFVPNFDIDDEIIMLFWFMVFLAGCGVAYGFCILCNLIDASSYITSYSLKKKTIVPAKSRFHALIRVCASLFTMIVNIIISLACLLFLQQPLDDDYPSYADFFRYYALISFGAHGVVAILGLGATRIDFRSYREFTRYHRITSGTCTVEDLQLTPRRQAADSVLVQPAQPPQYHQQQYPQQQGYIVQPIQQPQQSPYYGGYNTFQSGNNSNNGYQPQYDVETPPHHNVNSQYGGFNANNNHNVY